MKIYFVRHGQTASNKLGRIMSRTNDESLNEEGLQEVRNVVGEKASELEYDIVFTSPLRRAAETAQEFAQAKGLAAIPHDELMEREFGILSNKTWEEVDVITEGALNHKIWQQKYEHDLSPWQGESLEDTRARVSKYIEHIKANHSDKKPLVVTHGGVLRTLYMLFPEHAPKSFSNVSIHEFEV